MKKAFKTPIRNSSFLNIPLVVSFAIITLAFFGSKKVEASPTTELSISPSTQNINATLSGTIDVMLETGGESVAGVEFVITYDDSLFTIGSITPGAFFTDPGEGTPVEIIEDVTGGTIHYAVAFPLGSGYGSTVDGVAATINFTAGSSSGTSNFTFVTEGNPHTIVSDTTATDVLSITTGGSVTINDATAPTISNPLPSGLQTPGTTTANLQVTTNENATCKYDTVPDTAYASMDTTFVTTGTTSHSSSVGSLTDGTSYTFYVKCQDTSDNISDETTISFSIGVSPEINLTSISPDPGTDNTPSVVGTATDADGTISLVEYQTDSTAGAWTPCTADDGTFDEASEAYTCAVSSLSDGAHTIYIRATDNDDFSSPDGGNSDTYMVDTTGPTTPGTPSTASASNDTTPTWTWTASSDTGVGLDATPYTVEWSTDSAFNTVVGSDTSSTNSFTHTILLTDDTWYFRVKAEDALGNESSFSSNGSFALDSNVPPTVSIDAPATPTTDTTPTLTGSATDSNGTIDSVGFQADSTAGAWTACTADDGTFDEAGEDFTCTTGVLADGTHTIYIRSTDDGGAISAVESESVTIDTTAPSISLTAITPDPGTDTTPELTGTATDASTTVTGVEYQTDSTDGSWTACTADDDTFDEAGEDFTCLIDTLSEGAHTIYVRASDVMPNISNPSNDSYTVDTTGPTTPGDPSTASSTNDSTPTWTWAASTDTGSGLSATPYTVEWSTDPSFLVGVNTSTSSTNSFTHSATLTDGTWYFRVKSEDALGNESSYSNNGTFVLDSTAPAITITPISPDPGSDISPDLTGNATDASNTVSSVEFQVDATNGSWTACTADDGTFDESSEDFTCEISSLSDGAHIIYVRSTDSESNTSGSTANQESYTVDIGAPAVTLTPISPDPGTDTTPTISGSSTDSNGTVDSVEYQVDSIVGSWTACTSSDGTFDEATEAFSCTVNPVLSDGAHIIYVRSTDNLGNVSANASDSFTVDATTPTTPGDPSTTSPTNDTTPSWAWAASTDATAGLATPAYTVEWSQNSLFTTGVSTSTATSNSYTHTATLANGTWYFRVKAEDTLGNESEYSNNGTVTVDNTAPTITLVPLTPDPGTDNTPSLSGTATDAATALTAIQFQVDSTAGSWTTCTADDGTIDELSEEFTCSIVSALTEGSHTVYARATDSAGNTSGSTSNADTFVVDVTAPTTPGTPSSASSTTDSTPTWTWSASTDATVGLASPPYTVEWSEDNTFGSGVSTSTASSTTFTHSSALTDGTWYFRVKAEDTLGNESSYSANGSISINTSNQEPSVSITSSPTSPGTDSTPTVTGNATDSDGTINTVGFQIDATTGSWTACTASDGAYNSDTEAFSCAISGLADGANTIYLRVVDNDGAYTIESISYTLNLIDLTSDDLKAKTPDDEVVNTKYPRFKFTKATDVDNIEEYKIVIKEEGKTTFENYITEINPSAPSKDNKRSDDEKFIRYDGDDIEVYSKETELDDGDYEWRVYAMHNNGERIKSNTREFSIDTDKPELQIISVNGQDYSVERKYYISGNSFKVKVTVDKDSNVIGKWDNDNSIACEKSLDAQEEYECEVTKVFIGRDLLLFTAEDDAGNTTSEQKVFIGLMSAGQTDTSEDKTEDTGSLEGQGPTQNQDNESDDEVKEIVTTPNKLYDVRIQIKNNKGEPLPRVSVTLYSDPKTTLTDNDGWAVFKNVEAGVHRIVVSDGNTATESTITLTGERSENVVNITFDKQIPFYKEPIVWIIGAVLLVITMIIAVTRRKR